MTLGVLRERPTAAQPGAPGTAGFVRAPALVRGRASAVPEGRRSLSEVDLEHAYAGPLRLERCLCGGWIAAAASDWTAIALEVRVHRLSTRHQQWLNAAGWR